MTLSAYSAGETAKRSITVRAYESLDSAGKSVLWYLDVERLGLAEVCSLMGMAPYDVITTAAQARFNLRTAWVFEQMMCERTPNSCKDITLSVFLGKDFTPSGTTAEIRTQHLESCFRCSILSTELDNLPVHLRTVLFPFVIGPTVPIPYGN